MFSKAFLVIIDYQWVTVNHMSFSGQIRSWSTISSFMERPYSRRSSSDIGLQFVSGTTLLTSVEEYHLKNSNRKVFVWNSIYDFSVAVDRQYTTNNRQERSYMEFHIFVHDLRS